MHRTHHSPSPRRLAATTLVVGLTLSLAACTSDAEKVSRLITTQLDKCKASDKAFYEIDVFDGKDEILKDACHEGLATPPTVEDFHAKAKVGPYDWLAGVDEESGVWVLSQVDWEAMDRIRRTLRDDEPPADARERLIPHFDEAQKALPNSPWVRTERLQNLLKLRRQKRGKSPDPVGIGKDAQDAYDEVKSWGKDDHADAGGRARLSVISYYQAHKSLVEDSLENVGGQDEWLQNLVDQAVKDKNAEDEKKYRAELKKRVEDRPKVEAEIKSKIERLEKLLCAEVAELSETHAKSDDLRKEIAATKASVSCKPAAAPTEGEQ